MKRVDINKAGWGDYWVECPACAHDGRWCEYCGGEGGWPASAKRYNDKEEDK